MPRNAFRAVLLLLAATMLYVPAQASESVAPRSGLFGDVQIVDRDSGEVLPNYWHKGQRWVVGTPGHRYAVRLRNHAYGRVLAVVSIDGVNAISGQSAGWNQGGYVLEPWQSTDVLGWRKSQERVADFVFGNIEDSYAARTGRPENVGIIGVALFREANAVAPESSVQMFPGAKEESSAAKASPSAPQGDGVAQLAPMMRNDRAPPQGALGTVHGPAEESKVQMTNFERAQATPDLVISIRYDRHERLVAMGIIGEPRAPSPFPESAHLGFVPDPPTRPW